MRRPSRGRRSRSGGRRRATSSRAERRPGGAERTAQMRADAPSRQMGEKTARAAPRKKLKQLNPHPTSAPIPIGRLAALMIPLVCVLIVVVPAMAQPVPPVFNHIELLSLNQSRRLVTPVSAGGRVYLAGGCSASLCDPNKVSTTLCCTSPRLTFGSQLHY